eukprot:1160115-Pelagomonas_calceolata.AAC.4
MARLLGVAGLGNTLDVCKDVASEQELQRSMTSTACTRQSAQGCKPGGVHESAGDACILAEGHFPACKT